MVQIDISMGEALDRVTILRIKSERIKSLKGRARALQQYRELWSLIAPNIREAELGPIELAERFAKASESLYNINSELWNIEDKVRRYHVYPKSVDFVESVLRVPKLNDDRVKLKRQLDEIFGCVNGEVKDYV